MARVQTCETCRHWNKLANKGECRRYPPQLHDNGQYWPTTRAHQWCGEWTPKSEG